MNNKQIESFYKNPYLIRPGTPLSVEFESTILAMFKKNINSGIPGTISESGFDFAKTCSLSFPNHLLAFENCTHKELLSEAEKTSDYGLHVLAAQVALENSGHEEAKTIIENRLNTGEQSIEERDALLYWRAHADLQSLRYDKCLSDCLSLHNLRNCPSGSIITRLLIQKCTTILSKNFYEKFYEHHEVAGLREAMITLWELGFNTLSLNALVAIYHLNGNLDKDPKFVEAKERFEEMQIANGIFPSLDVPWEDSKDTIKRISEHFSNPCYHLIRDKQEHSFRNGTVQFTASPKIRNTDGSDELEGASISEAKGIDIQTFTLMYMLCLSETKCIKHLTGKESRELVQINLNELLTILFDKSESLPKCMEDSELKDYGNIDGAGEIISNREGCHCQIGVAKMLYKDENRLLPREFCKRWKFKDEREVRIFLKLAGPTGEGAIFNEECWGVTYDLGGDSKWFEESD